MMHYGVTLGRRYSFKQKKLFYDDLCHYIDTSKHPLSLISAKDKTGSATNDIVIGSLDTAETIIMAAYDTPSRIILPGYRYYPFDMKRNLTNENRNLVGQFLVSTFIFLGIYYLISGFAGYDWLLKILVVIIAALLIILSYLLLRGTANRINFNRNSAAVALLVSMTATAADKTAFVLLDNAVTSLKGLNLLHDHLKHDVKLILLDCLSDGDKLVIAHRKFTNDAVERLLSGTDLAIVDKLYNENDLDNNILGLSKQMIYIVSGSIENRTFLVRNTRNGKDYAYNNDRLVKIRNMLQQYIKEE